MTDDFLSDKHFLITLREIENGCEEFSLKELDSMDEKTINTYSNLGTVQSLLYRYACCTWGCKSTDHKLERTIGRAVSHCQASIRLIGFGYYDESLALTRNIAEIANLLALFQYDSKAFETWKAMDEITAWKEFSPVKVRKEIEKLKGIIPVSKEHYGKLCSIGTHITPTTSPQNFNEIKKPAIGAFFQELGFIVALNELALIMAIVGAGAFRLGTFDPDVKKEIIDATLKLGRGLGPITAQNMHTVVWTETRNGKENNGI